MITKVTYGNITEGSGVGVLAFQIDIDNQIFPPDQVGEVMKAILKFDLSKRRIVEIGGHFAPILNEQMLTLIMTLKDNGFHIQVNAPGDQYYPWFSMIDRLVVHINNFKIWPTFKCEDFVFHPLGDHPLIEPEVPKINNIILYVYPNLDNMEMLNFLSNAKNYWRIYPLMNYATSINIWNYEKKMGVENGTNN